MIRKPEWMFLSGDFAQFRFHNTTHLNEKTVYSLQRYLVFEMSFH